MALSMQLLFFLHCLPYWQLSSQIYSNSLPSLRVGSSLSPSLSPTHLVMHIKSDHFMFTWPQWSTHSCLCIACAARLACLPIGQLFTLGGTELSLSWTYGRFGDVVVSMRAWCEPAERCTKRSGFCRGLATPSKTKFYISHTYVCMCVCDVRFFLSRAFGFPFCQRRQIHAPFPIHPTTVRSSVTQKSSFDSRVLFSLFRFDRLNSD